LFPVEAGIAVTTVTGVVDIPVLTPPVVVALVIVVTKFVELLEPNMAVVADGEPVFPALTQVPKVQALPAPVSV